MPNVVQLGLVERDDPQAECKRAVVQRLEELLDRARKGELVAVGIGYELANGGIGSMYSCQGRPGALLGSIAHLEHRVLANLAVEDL